MVAERSPPAIWVRRLRAFSAVISVSLAACSPALDWRELHPAGQVLTFSLPCRPDAAQRQLPLAGGATVTWEMHACNAEGLTFAVAWGDTEDPSRVAPALAALASAGQARLRGRLESDVAAMVPGMTPQAGARQWRLRGQLPDGAALVQEAVVFAHGTRVFQATVQGAAPESSQTRPFFEALRLDASAGR